MRLEHDLDEVFAGRSNVRILRALYELPDGVPASAREIARRAGLSHPTALTALDALIDLGIVVRRRSIGSNGFLLNRHHAIYRSLASLFDWERHLREELLTFLRREVSRRLPWLLAAYLFGSSARRDMGSGSDIDLAILIPDDSGIDQAEQALAPVGEALRERFGNRLQLTLGASSVVKSQSRLPGAALWRRILAEGLPLI